MTWRNHTVVFLPACAVLTIVTLLTAASSAQAQKTRSVPPAGSVLTYKSMFSVKQGLAEPRQISGTIDTYKIASSSDLTAEGTIQPGEILAYFGNCEPGVCEKMASAGLKVEDGFIHLSVPPEIGVALAGKSVLHLRGFLQEVRDYPTPSYRDAVPIQWDDFPKAIVSFGIDCNKPLLESFFPIGKTAVVSVPCFFTTSYAQSHLPKTPPAFGHDGTLTLSYQGRGKVTLPSGDWSVDRVHLSRTSGDGALGKWEDDLEVSDTLGAVVREHLESGLPNSPNTNYVDRTLIQLSK